MEKKMKISIFTKQCLALFLIASVVFLTGCASGPSSYFRSSVYYAEDPLNVAIIPFSNLTSDRDAGKKISHIMVTHLLKSACFDVVEMGETLKAIKDARVRPDEGIDIDNIKNIGKATGADFLLMGVVEEYKIDSSTMLGEKVFVPEVSVIARLVSTKDGSIIWSANHHRRGDDQVSIFGIGRIDSISELTDVIVSDTIRSLVKTVHDRGYALKPYKNHSLSEEAKEESTLKDKASLAQEKAAIDKNIKASEMKAKKEKETLQKEVEALKKSKEGMSKEVEALKKEIQDMKKAAVTIEKPASAAPSLEHTVKEKAKVSAPAPVEVKKSPEEKVVEKKEDVKDLRQQLKDQYKKEYEAIKKQYPESE